MTVTDELHDTQPVPRIVEPAGLPVRQGAATPVPGRHPINWAKWGLGCAGLSMILFSGAVFAGLIIFPIVFRSLPGETRSRVVEKLPFFGTFQPTRIYRPTTLPTAQAADPAAVAALLETPVPAAVTPSITPTPTLTPTSFPTSLLVTISPTPLLGSFDTSVSAQQPTNTPLPSPTSLPTRIPTIPPTATEVPLPIAYHLDGIKRVYQKWNDCGPANLTQILQYYGWSGNEDDARTAIKPNNDDRNVSPWELVDFVRKKTGVKAVARVAGDLRLIKRLVSSNFGVIMETGYNLPDGWAGHYLTVLGYDDGQQTLFGGDTNLGFGADGMGQREDYTDLDNRWQAFNRTYIVVFPRDREQELAGILGRDADPNENIRHSLELAQKELNQNKDNPYAWHNLGAAYTQLGDYKRATIAFDSARNTGTQLPWRFLWYQFSMFEAYYKTGAYSEVIGLANITLANAPIEEARYWRAMATAATGDMVTAADDLKNVLRFNPNFSPAADALAKVQNGSFQPPVIAQGGVVTARNP
jgi:hypothetical protein